VYETHTIEDLIIKLIFAIPGHTDHVVMFCTEAQ